MTTAARSMVVASLLLQLSVISGAQQSVSDYDIDAVIDWQSGLMSLRVTTDVVDGGFNAPTAAFRAEQRIERDLPELLVQSLLQLPVDSQSRIQDRLRQEPELVQEIGELFRRGRKGFTRRTEDLRQIEVRYDFQLFPDIAGIFFSHHRAFPVDRVITWVPTREYTGIVIYAKEELPIHGTTDTTTLQPCFFPEIYDESMRLVLERLMVEPAAIDRWGVAAYTDELDDSRFLQRVGLSPLRIMASGIFGSIPTDIKIPVDRADEILSSDRNRRLLTEGRILIIIETENLVPPLAP